LSWNLGTLTSWNPLGHSMPVTGLLYLYLYMFREHRAHHQERQIVSIQPTRPPTQWQLPDVVLTQFVSPDDEHDVLETRRELKINTYKGICASRWSFTKNKRFGLCNVFSLLTEAACWSDKSVYHVYVPQYMTSRRRWWCHGVVTPLVLLEYIIKICNPFMHNLP